MEQRFYPKRCSSNSAETIASIEQVLTEILVRVPAKSLVRYKCVSKLWLSLLSDPRFCHRHTLHNPETPISAVFCDRSCRPFCFVPIDHDQQENQKQSESGSLPFNPLKFAQSQYHDDIKVVQSCKGLFLCVLFQPGLTPPFFVFNPTTNMFSTLIPPPATKEQVEPYVISIALAFDPSKSPHYKVVCLRTIDGSEDGTIYHILIYSSETKSWRILDSLLEGVFSIDYSHVLYWNGAINWLGIINEVAYFHVDEERHGYVENLPHFYEKDFDRRTCRYFQDSSDGRHLHLIDIYRPCVTRFEVLEMGKDYSGWFVKYLVNLYPIFRQNQLSDYRFVVLFLHQDGNEGEKSTSLLLHSPGRLISYNLQSKLYKSLDLTPKAGVNDSLLRVEASNCRYMETLACV